MTDDSHIRLPKNILLVQTKIAGKVKSVQGIIAGFAQTFCVAYETIWFKDRPVQCR